MNIQKYLTSVLVVVLLSGCATPNRLASFQALKANQVLIGKAGTGPTASEMQALSDALQTAYEQTVSDCVAVMNNVRRDVDKTRSDTLIIAGVGIVAGSIAVPALLAKAAAAKSTIAAWSGVSGSANAAQVMLNNNGLSPFQATAAYNSMRTDIKSAMQDYSGTSDPVKRAQAVTDLTIACQIRPLPHVSEPSPDPILSARRPSAPINVRAFSHGTDGTKAIVIFETPSDTGDIPITGFNVVSVPSGGVDADAGTVKLIHDISGLMKNTAYTFTAKATNARFSGSPSAPSASITTLP